MSLPEPRDARALAPLDDTDVALLAEVRALYATLDAPPADLVERVRFALDLETLDVEIGRLTALEREPAGVLGEELSRTITFDSESLTIMISLSVTESGAVRFDGWLAPPAEHVVEVRTATGTVTARADETGRFVAEPIARGMAQLVVRTHPGTGPADGRTVVTPSIVV